MTAKPTWTDEEKFWRSIRQAALAFVDAIETYRLVRHIDVRTSEAREQARAYQFAEKRLKALTIEPECDKL